METDCTVELLKQMVSEVSGVPIDRIDAISTWEELGMDSLEFMELLTDVAHVFKPIPKNRIFAIDNISDLCRELNAA